MTDPNPALERLRQLLALVAREEFHLLGVRERLFGGLPDDQLTEAWLRQTLATPEGIDRVESFRAKFGRMQDTLVDKLLPALLAVAQAPAPRRRYAACPAHCASAGSRQPNPTHTPADTLVNVAAGARCLFGAATGRRPRIHLNA